MSVSKRGVVCPLSSSQREIWFDQMLHPGVPLYNIGGYFRIDGPVEPTLFVKALNQVIGENDALRTVLRRQDPSPGQEFVTRPDWGIQFHDFSRQADAAPQALEWMQQEFVTSFPLYDDLLFHYALIKISDACYCFFFKQHHLIMDGWAISLTIKRLADAYNALAEGRSCSEAKPSYVDFVRDEEAYLGSGRFSKDQAYWLEKYRENPEPLIPRRYADRFKGAIPSQAATLWIERKFYVRAGSFAEQHGGTIFHLILGALCCYFMRTTRRRDMVVGLPILNRNTRAFRQTVGMFTSVSPARFSVDPKVTFPELMRSIGRELRSDYRHQRFPVSEINKACRIAPEGRQRLYDLTLSFERHDYDAEFAGAPVEGVTLLNGHEQNALAVFVREFHKDRDIRIDFSYSLGAFQEPEIQQVKQCFGHLLEEILKRPDAAVGRLALLPEEERLRVLHQFDAARAGYPRGETIVTLFERQAARTPGNVAVAFEGRQLTYRELNAQANQVARYMLAQQKIGPDDRVAVAVERSEWLVIAVLAVLKAGAAYVPIDPAYPEERIRFLASDSNARLILTQEHLRERLRLQCPVLAIEGASRHTQDTSNLGITVPASSLAYVIYTSGTTGTPKGAMIEHRNVVRLLFNDSFQFDFSDRDTWTLFHSICFDFSVWEIFGALLRGGKLVVIADTVTRDPARFLDVLRRERVTVLNQTPHAFYQLAAEECRGPKGSLDLRYVIFGGEALSPLRLSAWRERYPEAKLINMYGITETTVHVTFKQITEYEIENNISNIGKPIPTLSAYVMDADFNLMPVGAEGELFVGGEGVCRGYLNRPELTAERFVEDPFRKGEKLFRSGDLVRQFHDGEMEYVGRVDDQVKVRGFRIEPAEIEHLLLKHPRIREAAVLARTEDEEGSYLCAYYVEDQQDCPHLTAQALRSFLAAQLPGYMIPLRFVALAQIPLTPHGKIDKRALPAPSRIQSSEQSLETGMNPGEKVIAEVWKDVLSLDRVGVDEDFFHAGGDSIRAIRTVNRINDRLQGDLEIVDIYTHRTVRLLASRLQEKGQARENHQKAAVLAEMEELKRRVLCQERLSSDQIEDVFPMSDIQKGMAFHYLKHLGKGVYHDQFVYEMDFEDFDLDRFKKAFTLMVEKHPALRTSFNLADYPEFLQIVHKRPRLEIQEFDLTHLGKAQQEEFAAGVIRQDKQNPFDLAAYPLWRMRLFLLSRTKVCFLFSFHHAILDGWSFANLNVEVERTYRRLQTTPHWVPERLESTYKDAVAEEIVEKRKATTRDYWKNELAGYRRLELPAVYGTRPFEGMRTLFEDLGEDLLGKLKIAATLHGTSVRSLCFAAYAYVCGMLSYDEEVVVGSVTHVRPAAPDGDKTLGCFLNTVPVRLQIPSQGTWADYIALVERKLVEVKKNERLPLLEIAELLGEANPERNPIFDTLFNFMDFHVYDEPNRREPGRFRYEKSLNIEGSLNTNTQFDFELNLSMGRFILCPKFDPTAVTQELVERLCGYFERVLLCFISESQGQIDKHAILGPDETDRLLHAFNDTQREYSSARTIPELFEDRVEATPQNPAVVCGGRTLTYLELNEESNRVARALRESGVRAGRCVAVIMDRSIEMVAAVMAILKAGGAYVPVEPELPEARVRHILSSLQIEHVVTNCQRLSCVRAVSGGASRLILFPLDGEAPDEGAVISRDRIARYPADNLERTGGSEDVAYVIFTSGSTGVPKGVVVQHRPVINVIEWVNRTFRVTASDKLLFATSLSFDLSVYDVFGILAAGGCIRVASREELREPKRLVEIIRDEQITFWDSAPAALQQLVPYFPLVEDRGGDTKLRLVFLSGDWIPLTLPDTLKQHFKGVEVAGLGGATEATIWSNFHIVQQTDAHWPSIPYGKPIQNAKYYVLDRTLRLCPLTVAGDLYVGGPCLAAGYANDPELTESKFLTHPFVAGERIYRTGDKARWMTDGNMEFLGRSDGQVKIRGFRVEPGEIEHQLLQHPAVRQAVVTATLGRNGQKELAAYVVCGEDGATAGQGLSVAELRAHLARFLPDYMIPTYFVPTDRIPLTPNGKVDRKALPGPEESSFELANPYVPPANELEARLVRIWESVLARHPVGTQDNFFELGGQSLKATRLVSQIHKELSIDISLGDFFAFPTVAELARVAERQAADALTAIAPAPARDFYDVSHAQKRLWVLDQFEGRQIAYNTPASLVLRGDLDLEALKAAFRALIERHEVLRTTFAEVEGKPVQVVHDSIPFDIPITDLRGMEKSELVALNLAREDARVPFDLSRGPLMRVSLLRLEPAKWILLFNIHHIIFDGWSLSILIRELTLLYRGFEQGEQVSLQPLRVQYKDYAVWQNRVVESSGMKAPREYWHGKLAGKLPVLNFPADFPRPAAKTFRGKTSHYSLGKHESALVRAFGRENDATLFMTLLALVKVLLFRYTGQEDIVVGSPIAGRGHPDLQEQIGFYVNTLALRDTIQGSDSFAAILEKVKRTATDAYQHQIYPFDRLVDELDLPRDMSHTPLFDVAVALQERDDPLRLGALRITPFEKDYGISKFDLTFTFDESDEEIGLDIEFNSDLFKGDRIDRLCSHLQQLAGAACRNPARPVQELNLLPGQERVQLLDHWNETATVYPKEKGISQLFEEQAARTPGNTALVFGSRQLTYAQLNERANRVARFLKAKGISKNEIVGLLLDRSPDRIIGILAILKAGGVYLPLGAELPQRRIRYMLEETRVNTVLSQSHLSERLAGMCSVVHLDGTSPYNGDSRDLPPQGSGADLACVMYTSGSTGEPKAILVSQYSATRIAKNTNYVELKPDDRVLQLSNYSFDGSLFDILGALLNGAALVVPARQETQTAYAVSDILKREKISVFFVTTALFNALVDIDGNGLSSVRKVLFGGERVSVEHVRKALRKLGPGRIVHVYGPTEATVFSTYHEVDTVEECQETIPIGKPISNSSVYLLDRLLQPVPTGVPGYLYIGGDGLSTGYLNRPRETAEKFIPNPFRDGQRLYVSGDIGRRLSDGSIEFLGREDDQVKIRGFRVELGEIEARLLAHEDIQQALVMLRERSTDRAECASTAEDKYLCAYLISRRKLEFSSLEQHLSRVLPDYMIPTSFVFLNEFPLNAHGKVDKASLPVPHPATRGNHGDHVAPRNEIERHLVRIWEEVLGVSPVGIHDDFFELGGHSLRATQVVSRIYREINTTIALKNIFTHPTIAEIAQVIEAVDWANTAPASKLEREDIVL